MNKRELNLIEGNIQLLRRNKELFEDIKILLRYINQEYKTDEEFHNLLINVSEISNYYNNKKSLMRKEPTR